MSIASGSCCSNAAMPLSRLPREPCHGSAKPMTPASNPTELPDDPELHEQQHPSPASTAVMSMNVAGFIATPARRRRTASPSVNPLPARMRLRNGKRADGLLLAHDQRRVGRSLLRLQARARRGSHGELATIHAACRAPMSSPDDAEKDRDEHDDLHHHSPPSICAGRSTPATFSRSTKCGRMPVVSNCPTTFPSGPMPRRRN